MQWCYGTWYDGKVVSSERKQSDWSQVESKCERRAEILMVLCASDRIYLVEYQTDHAFGDHASCQLNY